MMADATGGGFIDNLDPTQVLQFGLLGMIFLCIVFRRFLVPEWTLKDAEKRAEAERADLVARLADSQEQVAKLQAVFEERMIPLLTQATAVNAQYNEEMAYARFTGNRSTPPPHTTENR